MPFAGEPEVAPDALGVPCVPTSRSMAVFRSVYGNLGIASALPGSAWPSPHPLPEGALPKKG